MMGKKKKPVRRQAVLKRKQVKPRLPTVEEYIRKLSKERLVDIVLDQAGSDESLKQELLDEILERFGKPIDAIEHARQLVDNAVSTELNCDHRGYAKPVNYGPVHAAFERLFKEEQYETLLELGPIVAAGSQHHIELSADDFEPHYSVSECIGFVMQALLKSDWPKHDKIAYAVRLVIEDDFCACEEAEEVLNRRWARRDWKQAAETLRKLVPKYPEGNYTRKRLEGWIAKAEEKGGV
jgi:hypothetical protein